MDAPGADKTQLLAQLKETLLTAASIIEPIDGERMEEIAMQNETGCGRVSRHRNRAGRTIRAMIACRELFPAISDQR
ncbi:MAG: hypothetical protein R2683_03700 [Bifidobacterium adolescentis]